MEQEKSIIKYKVFQIAKLYKDVIPKLIGEYIKQFIRSNIVVMIAIDSDDGECFFFRQFLEEGEYVVKVKIYENKYNIDYLTHDLYTKTEDDEYDKWSPLSTIDFPLEYIEYLLSIIERQPNTPAVVYYIPTHEYDKYKKEGRGFVYDSYLSPKYKKEKNDLEKNFDFALKEAKKTFIKHYGEEAFDEVSNIKMNHSQVGWINFGDMFK